MTAHWPVVKDFDFAQLSRSSGTGTDLGRLIDGARISAPQPRECVVVESGHRLWTIITVEVVRHNVAAGDEMVGEQPIGGPKFGEPRRIDPQADTRDSWSQGVPPIDRVDLQDLPLVY